MLVWGAATSGQFVARQAFDPFFSPTLLHHVMPWLHLATQRCRDGRNDASEVRSDSSLTWRRPGSIA